MDSDKGSSETMPMVTLNVEGADSQNNYSKNTSPAVSQKSVTINTDQITSQDTTNGQINQEITFPDAPDGFNQYRNKKSLTQGMLDVALFTSNVNQLKSIVVHTHNHGFQCIFTMVLLVISLLLQIAVGLLLLLSARYNVCKPEERKIVYQYGNYVVAGIFLVTTINLFIAVFYDHDQNFIAPILSS